MPAKSLKNKIIGLTIFTLGIINLILAGTVLILLSPFKLIKNPNIQKKTRAVVEAIGKQWGLNNLLLFNLFLDTKWEIDCPETVNTEGQYFIICNHQSWVDIFVNLEVFQKRAPIIRFFMKDELKWLPFVGTGCMVLDYPFMKRYSQEFLKKNPHLKGKDLETTQKLCSKFKGTPVAILNFAEGTRFTQFKKKKQSSPYEYLLRPKAGGLAYALAAFSGEIKKIIDVTILYPNGKPPTFVEFLCNQVSTIKVVVNVLEPPENVHLKDYSTDLSFKHEFQHWLAKIWHDKDTLMKNYYLTHKETN